jgi:hypothetical protein
MNVWALDGESVESRLAGVKKTCFADQVEVVSTSGWGVDAPSQRRKQRGRVEFLVEDQHGSDDDDPRKGQCDSPTETSNAKASLISSADVVEAVESLRGAEPAQVTSSKKDRRSRKEEKLESQTRSIQDITVHHLVREFLLMHCHDDVVKILDQERVSGSRLMSTVVTCSLLLFASPADAAAGHHGDQTAESTPHRDRRKH